MAITLAQAKMLSQDKLTHFVIDEFVKSRLINALVFDNTVKPQGGNTLAYVYNRVLTQPTASGRTLNTEYSPQEADTKQYTANLKPMGGSFQVDRVIARDETQVVNHVQFQLAQKVKATIALFHDNFINGDSDTDAKDFDGIEKVISGSATDLDLGTIDLSTANAIETNARAFLYALRKLVGSMDGATHILVNNETYVAFQAVADFIPNVRYSRDELGNGIMHYGVAEIVDMGDKPGTVLPVIDIDESGLTSMYAVRIGLDGVHAVSPDGSDVVETFLPDFTTPGAVKTGEVEAVWASVVKATKSAGVLRNIKVLTGE